MPDESVRLGELAEELTAKVRAGELPEVEDYVRRHLHRADRIRELFPALWLLEGMPPPPRRATPEGDPS
jgi:hypothetical protein